MRVLLDTHVFIWWCQEDVPIRPEVEAAIMEAEEALVSVVSAWEFAILQSLGRLTLPVPFEDAINENGFRPLPVSFRHAAAIAALPFAHRDPFDRMLVAQAKLEGLTLVTRDRKLAAYGIDILAA